MRRPSDPMSAVGSCLRWRRRPGSITVRPPGGPRAESRARTGASLARNGGAPDALASLAQQHTEPADPTWSKARRHRKHIVARHATTRAHELVCNQSRSVQSTEVFHGRNPGAQRSPKDAEAMISRRVLLGPGGGLAHACPPTALAPRQPPGRNRPKPAPAHGAAGHARPRPWRQGPGRDRRLRHLREAHRPRRGRGTAPATRGRPALSGGTEPRSRDVFIPLEDRVAIAQERGAALFVSMHADALTDHSVRGASVYTLADTASDAQTRGPGAAGEFGRPLRRPGLPQHLARGRPHPGEPRAAGDAHRARRGWRAASSATSTARRAAAAEPVAACRVRRAEGGRISRACWWRWGSCRTAGRGGAAPAEAPRAGRGGTCSGRSTTISPAPRPRSCAWPG